MHDDTLGKLPREYDKMTKQNNILGCPSLEQEIQGLCDTRAKEYEHSVTKRCVIDPIHRTAQRLLLPAQTRKAYSLVTFVKFGEGRWCVDVCVL